MVTLGPIPFVAGDFPTAPLGKDKNDCPVLALNPHRLNQRWIVEFPEIGPRS